MLSSKPIYNWTQKVAHLEILLNAQLECTQEWGCASLGWSGECGEMHGGWAATEESDGYGKVKIQDSVTLLYN